MSTPATVSAPSTPTDEAMPTQTQKDAPDAEETKEPSTPAPVEDPTNDSKDKNKITPRTKKTAKKEKPSPTRRSKRTTKPTVPANARKAGRRKAATKKKSPSTPRVKPVSNDEDGVYYEIEDIVGKRVRKGTVEYRVRWKGYSPRNDSWQSEDDLCTEAFEFAKKFDKK